MENSEEQKIYLFSEGNSYKLYQGSMLDMLDVIEPNSIDAIVTDPPYELNFMGKGWDNSGIAFQKETWENCLKVLKPGGYLLSFGGSRTSHRIACAIEDAGFEIRDTIMWLYGSGFPKSMNIAKGVEAKLTTGSANKQAFKDLSGEKVDRGNFGYNSMWYAQGGRPADYNDIDAQRLDKLEPTTEEAKRWLGFGTALKPAYEPIIVARKPCEGSCVDNVLKYGVGGINIDECRIGTDTIVTNDARKNPMAGDTRTGAALGMFQETDPINSEHTGRFPANVILTYDDTDFEEVCGGMPETDCSGAAKTGRINPNGIDYSKDNHIFSGYGSHTGTLHNDSGSAARYFYCAKASKRDRDEGLDSFDVKSTGELQGRKEGSAGSVMNPMRPDGHIRNNPLNPYAGAGGIKRNVHPTVKPTALMSYLIRLVTPKGGTILDPFNGSGSTGKAAMYENKDRNAGYKYIGIELTSEYLPISDARIRYAIGDTTPVEYKTPTNPTALKKPSSGFTQISLFDLPE